MLNVGFRKGDFEMIYGYARVSTERQEIGRQVRNLENAGVDKIYQEKYTGTTVERPHWQKLKEKVVAGDVIVFDSASRMSRDCDEGYKDYMELYDKGVELRFLKQPFINTTTYKTNSMTSIPKTSTSADLILQGVEAYMRELARGQIRMAFNQAEIEIQALRQRTKEGLREAKARGKKVGRPKGSVGDTAKAKRSKKAILAMSKDFKGTMQDKEIMEILKIAPNTYYKYKRQLKEANNGKGKRTTKRKCTEN